MHHALAVTLAEVHFLDPLASWNPALAVVAAVGDCHSPGPAHIAPAVVVACALAIAAAVSHSRRYIHPVVAAAVVHIRPADHCSSRRPSRAARIRADRSRNRSTAGCTGCRSLHTAAVPATRVPGRNIVAVAGAVAAGAAVGARRTAADMPW